MYGTPNFLYFSDFLIALDDTIELWNFLLRDRFSHYNDWLDFLHV